MKNEFRRPSAALVLGAMAGSLAAMGFLPTAVPLLWQILKDEERQRLRQTQAASYIVLSQLGNEFLPTDELRVESGLRSLSIHRPGEPAIELGEPLPVPFWEQACEASEGSVVLQSADRRLWAVTCAANEDGRVVAAVPFEPAGPARRVISLVLLLGLAAGLITAVGVLRVLQPLSKMSQALARVGAGERGVRMPRLGLTELDDLADRLNAAARSVEDREDAILARIEVVQEMARMVAHEIRNPLQSLELLTSLIASEGDAHERLEIAGSIHNEIRTLEQVVTRLLRESAARGSLRLQITEQPIGPLVEQVIALRRPQANGQSVRLYAGPMCETEVALDQALLKRSIENLVLNALQAVLPGTGEVRVSVVDEVEWILIAVDDNGPGVAPEIEAQVFEPNVTSKEHGTGIGLVLVKGVIEAHGGYILYTRSALGGARFEARLPRNRLDDGGRRDEPA